jgi:ABC-type uncharacterized transport system substrate-binding protein
MEAVACAFEPSLSRFHADVGTSIFAANHQLGIFTAQVLRGTKPADLPVEQASKFGLIVNLKRV